MNTETKSFLFSFALHLTVLAAAVSFADMSAPQKAPVLIDFTVESVQGTKNENIKNDPGGAPASRPAGPARRSSAVKALPVFSRPDSFPKHAAEPAPLEQSPEAVPLARTTAVSQLPPASAAIAGSAGFTSSRQGNGSGTGTGSGHGPGTDQSGGDPWAANDTQSKEGCLHKCPPCLTNIYTQWRNNLNPDRGAIMRIGFWKIPK